MNGGRIKSGCLGSATSDCHIMFKTRGVIYTATLFFYVEKFLEGIRAPLLSDGRVVWKRPTKNSCFFSVLFFLFKLIFSVLSASIINFKLLFFIG